ncbi:MAG: hypothetical protein GX443_08210 [Deltaproteobacteria bacterium]|nr:hypothetical protein [Deltaproteobacteria bacterium]
MEENLELGKVAGILLKRKWWFILPFAGSVILAGVIALVLPNIFKSTATILIQNQQIPSTFVPSTITSYAQERIQSILQEVMSRSRILGLVEKYNLFADKREKFTTEELVERIRKRISLETISAEVTKETQAQPIRLAIAFSLSYQDENARTAQAVTNEVASFYLEKNAEARQKMARGTADFLEEQIRQEKGRIDDLQTRLAEFQREHLEELPEYSAFNMQKLEKLNATISDLSMQIRSLEEQGTTLRGNLTQLDPYAGGAGRVLSPAERLQQAQMERAQLLSRYSEQHPAVMAKNQEIALLQEEGALEGGAGQGSERLRELEGKLASLKARYGEKHPDVVKTAKEMERVRREMDAGGNNPAYRITGKRGDATNPAYLSLQSELDRIAVSVKSLKGEKKRLEEQMQQVYRKLHAMPQVAKEFNDLDTEFKLAKAHYAELQQKLAAARVSQGMEEGQLGEAFLVVEPAFLPEKPFKPNRLAILLIGVVLGGGFSVGMVALREFTDRSVRDAEGLEKLAGIPVISVIPRILTEGDRSRSRRRRIVAAASAACGILVAVLVFHLVVMDLDVFYAKVERYINRKIP